MNMLCSDKRCDHTSVGMLVWREEKILLVERKRFPFGFAAPAGHVDDDISFEAAAKRELEEEVGLKSENLKILAESNVNNICRRKGGTWHHWKIYQVETEGNIKRNTSETVFVGWFTIQEIKRLAQRTEDYLGKEVSEGEWQNYPGLEEVWYWWFKTFGII